MTPLRRLENGGYTFELTPGGGVTYQAPHGARPAPNYLLLPHTVLHSN